MKRPPDFETQLGGQTWKVHFVRKGHAKLQGDNWGMCYWSDKAIYVRYDLAEKTVRDTLIHELLHGTNELLYVAEEWVSTTATEVNESLTKAGM